MYLWELAILSKAGATLETRKSVTCFKLYCRQHFSFLTTFHAWKGASMYMPVDRLCDLMINKEFQFLQNKQLLAIKLSLYLRGWVVAFTALFYIAFRAGAEGESINWRSSKGFIVFGKKKTRKTDVVCAFNTIQSGLMRNLRIFLNVGWNSFQAWSDFQEKSFDLTTFLRSEVWHFELIFNVRSSQIRYCWIPDLHCPSARL